MKKILLFIGVFICTSIYSQSDTTCITAISIDTNGIVGNIAQTSSLHKWYKYTAGTDTSDLLLLNRNYTDGELIVKIELYSGTCTGLTLIASDTISSISDSVLQITNLSQVINDIYYIRVTKIGAVPTVNFEIYYKSKQLLACSSCMDGVSEQCNLVCNSDFESNVGIPSVASQIYFACPWATASGANPDYLHGLSPNPSFGVPINQVGTQLSFNFAAGDQAYAGLGVYNPSSAYTEYMYQKLKAPMIAGACYIVSMKVSRADKYKYQVADLGMYISVGSPVIGGTGPLPYVAAQTIMSGGFITSVTVWTTVSGTYTAIGGEQYLTIGRFGIGGTAPTIVSGTINGAYYYFDEISVVPVPFTIAAAPSPICLGESVNLTTNSCSSVNWTSVPASAIALTPSLSTTAIPSVAGVTTFTGLITFIPATLGPACIVSDDASVTVNPLPIVIVNSPTICAGQTTTLTASGATTYSWSTGATTSSITVTPGTTTSYTVTGTALGCSNTVVANVTVNPLPTITVNSPTICIGQTASLTASGAVIYIWSAGATSTGVNTAGASPTITTSYTVTGTDSNGCTNTAVATVTVGNPPVAINSPTICTGATANLTATGATTYTWSSGVTPTGVNTGTASPATTTSYTVTGTTAGCTATAVSAVTVNPVADVFVPTNYVVCAGATIPATTFASSVGGVTYAWTNSNTAIGLAASGTGNISSFTATNTGTTAITATITVAPSVGPCPGTSASYTITVNPNPNVTIPANITYCVGGIVPASLFTSGVAGTTFSWTNSNTATGLASTSGTGNVPSFTATNSGTTVLTSTITVTPTTTATGCIGSPVLYTITVNPISTVNTISNITQCAGTTISASAFTSVPTGATFTWTNSNPSIGLVASGTGNTPSFTAINAGTTPITASITVTPVFGSCPGTSTSYTITINPIPSVSGIPASATYCVGATVSATSFTSSVPGTIFTWTNSNTFIGLGSSGSGNVPSFTASAFSGTSTGTITITPTDPATGCQGTPVSYTITVNEYPTMSVPADISDCAGTLVTGINFLSIPSGATFTWTNSNPAIGLASSGSGNIPPFTLTNTTTGPISGTITVTPTFGGCVGTSASFTITVFPSPVIIITATPAIIPLGGSSTLTASGVATYSWSTGATTNPISVSPTATTTYTVTGTNQYGCTGTGTATVTVVNYPCTVVIPPGISPTGGTIPNGANSAALFGSIASITGNFKVAGTFTINSQLNFVGCNIIMEASGTTVPNIQIAGAAPVVAILSLTQNTHVYSCTVMWDGIYVFNGGKIITNGNVIIEDAINGVNIAQSSSQPSTFTATAFNKNLVAIKLSANSLTASPITLTNSIVTCRQFVYTSTIPATNPTILALKTDLAGSPPSMSPINLLVPYSSQRGFMGVSATSVNTLTIGNPATGMKNIFDAIMTGINIANPASPNTIANIYNNGFQYLLGPSGIFSIPVTVSAGFGINAVGTNSTALNTINIGGTFAQGNTFRNIYTAVNISNYKTVNIQRNAITNITTGPFTGVPTFIRNYGNGGIFVRPAQASNVLISDQILIKNCATGIWVNRGVGPINPNILQIENNGSAGSPCIVADVSGYCTNGILITDLSGATSSAGLWSISNNFIREATNCISIINVKKVATSVVPYNIFGNSCRTRYALTGMRTGIEIRGCRGLNIVNNHTNYTPTGTAYVAGDNIQAYGLFVQNSTNMTIRCNLLENAGRSMTFDGPCSSSTTAGFGITQNTMRRAQHGLVLLSSSTVIGQQGDIVFASNNVWDMSTTPNFIFQTVSSASNTNTASPIYVKAIGGTNVTVPTLNSGSPIPYSTTGSPPGIRPSIFFPLVACSGTPPPALATGSSGMTSAQILSYTTDLKNLEEDSTLLPTYNIESRWQLRKFVFDEVDDNMPYSSHPALWTFYSSHLGGNFNKFVLVDRKISQGFFIQANIINNNIVPVNIVESNQKEVNTQILLGLTTPSYVYSAGDINTLYAIAYQCPLQGGNAVYQARIALMTIAENVIEFPDNCDYNSERSMQTMNSNSVAEVNNPFKLYPNPNNGNMVLEYIINATDKAEINISDISGKLINSYLLNSDENKVTINEEHLKNGVYFYQVIINGKVKQSDKLIIIK